MAKRITVTSASKRDNNAYPTTTPKELGITGDVHQGDQFELTVRENFFSSEEYTLRVTANRADGSTVRFDTYVRSFPRPTVNNPKKIYLVSVKRI